MPFTGRMRVQPVRGLDRWVVGDGRAMALGRGIYGGLSWAVLKRSLLTNIQRWISLATICILCFIPHLYKFQHSST